MNNLLYIIKSIWIAFSMPIGILGALIFGNYLFKKKIKENKLCLNYYRIVKVVIGILVICFVGIEILIINYPKYDNKKDDYIIVLGAGLDSGRTPNMILSGRLDAAIKSQEENPTQIIVVSGGQGKDEYVSEAEAMKEYLEKKGIDGEKIIMEDKSRNTDENLKFSKKKIEEHSNKSIDQVNIKIVTTDYHAFRSSILAKKNGYVNFDNYSSSTIWYFVPYTHIREAIAVVKSTIFDR